MIEQGLEVKGTEIPNQKPIQGTEKRGSGMVGIYILLGVIVLLCVGGLITIYFDSPTSLTALQNDSNDLNVSKISSDLNLCEYYLARDDFYLQQIGDLNFPYLTINFPLKLNTFQGIILVDNNKSFALDVNTMRRLVQEYGVTQ